MIADHTTNNNIQETTEARTLVLVDQNDTVIGFGDKVESHLGEGVLHRAFSLFIFNEEGKLLLQKRADEKMLWPGYWSNSCCSHPYPEESYEEAAKRRAVEELSIVCDPTFVSKFVYNAKYQDIGSENELCAILISRTGQLPDPTVDEVSDWRWVSLNDLKKETKKTPEKFTPWFLLELEILEKEHRQLFREFSGSND